MDRGEEGEREMTRGGVRVIRAQDITVLQHRTTYQSKLTNADTAQRQSRLYSPLFWTLINHSTSIQALLKVRDCRNAVLSNWACQHQEIPQCIAL
uniref:Uncharacterized protein n=1 Tax=Anguilla anguilla TaxID=7936 RepID=A0A0E9T3A5_ANGAN